jgi:hypothetical protein
MSQKPQSFAVGHNGASLPFTAFFSTTQERAEDFRELQESIGKVLQDTGMRWFAHLRQEAERSTRLSRALVTARSYPEAAVAWQAWASEEIETISQDGKEMMDNGMRIAEATARFMSGYLHGNGKSS